MNTTSYRINDNLYLVSQQVSTGTPTVSARPAVNHLAVLDCSGSMSYDLPKIREQLKRKLPKLLGPSDTISIIWFSGRDQYGVLLEAEPVATLTDLKAVENAIDRWIRPVGMTGFKQPLDEVSKVIERVSRKNPGAFNLIFMSDGFDNQWNRQDILNSAQNLSKQISSATFVEYGYYADRALLTAMAEKCGGNLIFAEDFDRYAPSFENALSKEISGAKKVKVILERIPVNAFAFTAYQGTLVSYSSAGDEVEVPDDSFEIFYLSRVPAGVVTEVELNHRQAVNAFFYAAVALYAQRMNSDIVLQLLKKMGDVTFIKKFANCFGKQKYSEFIDLATKAVFDDSLRLSEGYNPSLIPADDAFTILDFLRVASEDENNHVLLDSSDFSYSKIGRGRIDANEVLTSDEQEQLALLREELKTADLSKAKEIADAIAAIVNKPTPLKFVADKPKDGYSISGLVFAEERPNVSFRVRKEGTVDISKRTAWKTLGSGLASAPADFPTFTYRNYAVIKDGLVNIKKLPMRMTAGTIKALFKAGMPIEAVVGFEGEDDDKARTRIKKGGKERFVNITVNLEALPIINRKMVQNVSANELFTLEYLLTVSRAAQKVYNTYKKELFPKTSENYTARFGAQAAEWLKEQGITDYNGFNPKGVVAPVSDVYIGKELNVSIKGLSSLPKVEDVKARFAEAAKNKTAPKLTAGMALMAPFVEQLENFIKTAGEHNAVLEKHLDKETKDAVEVCRKLIAKKAEIVFSVVVGQTWFPEFKDLSETQLKVNVAGIDVEGKVEQKEIEVKI